jgi:hypothetical protein
MSDLDAIMIPMNTPLLPAHGHPITLHDARTLGLTWRHLQPDTFLKVARDLYTPRPDRADQEFPARVRAALTHCHAIAAGGLTALKLYGVDLPQNLDNGPIDLLIPAEAHRSRLTGLRTHRSRTGPWTNRHDIPLAAPWATWLQAAPDATADELVILGDGLTRRQQPVTTLDSLTRYTQTSPGLRGIAKARQALPLIRPGTDSPRETISRLLVVHAGLPCPTVNPAIPTTEGPKYLDMAYLAAKTGLEYDGHHHETTMAADARRRRLLQDLGWQIIPITDDDLRHQPDAILRSVATALAQRTPQLLTPAHATTPGAARAIMARLLPHPPH